MTKGFLQDMGQSEQNIFILNRTPSTKKKKKKKKKKVCPDNKVCSVIVNLLDIFSSV